jgi:hypothetical protein
MRTSGLIYIATHQWIPNYSEGRNDSYSLTT